MTSASTQHQDLESRLGELQPDDLTKVLEYIDFLAFKRRQSELSGKTVAEHETPYRVAVKLEGLWEDHDINDADISTARKEMWAGFGEMDL